MNDDNLEQVIISSQAKKSEILLHLNTPTQAIPSTLPSLSPVLNIDYNGDSTMRNNIASQAASQIKHNLGKLRLLGIGYITNKGANLLTLTVSIAKVITLSNKEMPEAFGNLLQSMSDE